jgi:hypothetical protein
MIVEVETKKMNLNQNDQENIHQGEIDNRKRGMDQKNIHQGEILSHRSDMVQKEFTKNLEGLMVI